MKTNVGSADRIVRIILAAVGITLGFTLKLGAVLETTVFIISAALLVTAFVGFCPAYLPFGISTRKKKVNT